MKGWRGLAGRLWLLLDVAKIFQRTQAIPARLIAYHREVSLL
jgi:hypothetical protein